MQTIGFINKKGGAGKTHTCVGLAAAFHASGARTGIIDTDPNGSAMQWLETYTDLDGAATTPDTIEALFANVAGDFDVLFVDTPPNDEDAIELIAAAVDLVVIPCAPTGIEVRQLGKTIALVGDTPWVVVPNRVEISTTSGRLIRQLFDEVDIAHTTAVIPKRQAVADSFGAAPPKLAYAALADELRGRLEALVPA